MMIRQGLKLRRRPGDCSSSARRPIARQVSKQCVGASVSTVAIRATEKALRPHAVERVPFRSSISPEGAGTHLQKRDKPFGVVVRLWIAAEPRPHSND
jgi:hypothetical protein